MPLWMSLALVPGLIALNAFFVAAEYSVVAIRPAQIAAMGQGRWRRAARAIDRLKGNPGGAIGAIQVCITMTNLLLGWVGEPALSAVLLRLLGPLAGVVPDAAFQAGAFALAFVVVTLLTVVFSELLPKALTLRYVAAAAALTAVPVLALVRVTRPLVWLMNAMANAVTRPLGLGRVDDVEPEHVTVGELRLMASRAGELGALTERSKSLVLNSLGIAERRAEQVMVPRPRVAYLDLRRSMGENRRVMDQHLYTRLPLCDGGMDRVVGVVPVKEFLTAYQAEGDVTVLSLLAHPPAFAPENVPLDRLLGTFHEHRTQMVFLADEHGGVSGLVTLRDVVDELVGEIGERNTPAAPVRDGNGGRVPDPADAGGRWVVPGGMPVHELARLLGRAGWASGTSVTTVNGLITARLHRIPRGDDHVEIDGVRLLVRSVAMQVAREVEVVAVATGPEVARRA